ncbi:unnamed protein product [Somion occarium]|uniref:Uncharacterized protein n=1 Tax=Somion occarium TaxID=3059160 RepID=A0ABP1CY20_9APHY
MSIYLRTTYSPLRSSCCWSLAVRRRGYAVNAIHNHLQKSDKKHHSSTGSQAPAKASHLVAQTKTSLLPKKSRKQLQEERATVSSEKLLDNLEQIRKLESLSQFDVWATPVPLYDLHVPTKLSHKKNASLLDHARALWATTWNWYRNVATMRQMAKADAFPAVRVKSWRSRQIFAVQSTPWLAPFRREALDIYKDVQGAVATGDEKVIKKYTLDTYRARMLKMISNRDPSLVFIWKFHSENAPCKVVSIRATEGYGSIEPPRIGNRFTTSLVN